MKPVQRELRKQARNGMDKRRLQIAKGERKGRRVAANLGTDMDWGKGTRGVDVHMVVHRRTEWGGKEGRVVVKVLGTRNDPKEVSA